MPQQYVTWIVFGVLIVGMMWMMSRSARKAREQMAAQAEEAVQVGNTVVTRSGFFGKIVDIDGDAVTLMSPNGDETVWLKSAIQSKAELPFDFGSDEETQESPSQSDQ